MRHGHNTPDTCNIQSRNGSADTKGQSVRDQVGTICQKELVPTETVGSWTKRRPQPWEVEWLPQQPEASQELRAVPQGSEQPRLTLDPIWAVGPVCYSPQTVSEGLRMISGLQLDDFPDHSLGCWPLSHRALPGNSQYPSHLTLRSLSLREKNPEPCVTGQGVFLG